MADAMFCAVIAKRVHCARTWQHVSLVTNFIYYAYCAVLTVRMKGANFKFEFVTNNCIYVQNNAFNCNKLNLKHFILVYDNENMVVVIVVS